MRDHGPILATNPHDDERICPYDGSQFNKLVAVHPVCTDKNFPPWVQEIRLNFACTHVARCDSFTRSRRSRLIRHVTTIHIMRDFLFQSGAHSSAPVDRGGYWIWKSSGSSWMNMFESDLPTVRSRVHIWSQNDSATSASEIPLEVTRRRLRLPRNTASAIIICTLLKPSSRCKCLWDSHRYKSATPVLT